MTPKSLLSTGPLLPWRVRHGFEQWLETACRTRRPAAYRWLHFGRSADPVRALTKGPAHHFFGYYDKTPWNASGSLVLAHEAAFGDRAPGAQDAVAVGVVRPGSAGRFEPLARSLAWNWQQGTMLQWHPADPERLFVHNDRRDGRLVAVVRDVDGREQALLERPVCALAPDGHHAWSLNFARLQTHRPGYGHAGVADPWAAERAPDADGLHLLDLHTGRSRLVVSLGELARRDPTPAMAAGVHYVNHVQVSPGGTRVAFFHVWTTGAGRWEVRLYTAATDGSDLRCVLDTGRISHYDWRDERHLLVWARLPGGGERFVLCDGLGLLPLQVFGEGRLTEDGHCSYSPDRRWLLDDTYPDRHDMRTLMLVRCADGRRIDLARLHSPKARWWGELRCDLHPRWSRDGRQVCIDSVHEGTRQMYVLDVTRWTTP